MFYKIKRFVDDFLSLAALEWGPDADWIPKKLKEHDVFKQFPQSKPQKIFGNFGLDDFRKQVQIDALDEEKEDLARDFKNQILEIFKLAENNLTNLAVKLIKSSEKDNKKLGNISNTLELIYKINKYLDLHDYDQNLKLNVQIKADNKNFDGKPIRFDKGMSLFKVYIKISSLLNKIADLENYDEIRIPPLETLSEFKNLSKQIKPGHFYIVFSTKIEDLAGISSRGITSCQKLFCEQGKPVDFEDKYIKGIIGTILSRYVGVIYLTTGSEYKNRGEKMLFRSLVRIVYDIKNDEPYILVDKMYPQYESEILEAFKIALKEKTSIEIISPQDSGDEYPDVREVYYTKEDDEENIPDKYRSYNDTKLQRSPAFWWKRLESGQINNLAGTTLAKLDPANVVKHKDRWDLIDKMSIAEALPINYLPEFIRGEDDVAILRIAIKRMPDLSAKINLMTNEYSYLNFEILKQIPENKFHLVLYKYSKLSSGAKTQIIMALPKSRQDLVSLLENYEKDTFLQEGILKKKT